LAGAEGAQVVVVATDERQAGLCHRIASRMVELHPELEARVQQYADALTVPSRGSSFQVLPAVPKRLEGLDFTLAIVDEAGRVDTEVYEVVSLATGKQKSSVVLAIGTPGPELEETVLGRLRTYCADHPDDPLAVWREHSAAGSKVMKSTANTAGNWPTPPSTTSWPATASPRAYPPRCGRHRSAGLGCAS
jgi:hypothetical protein